MVTLLINILIKDKENTNSPKVRAQYATITGVVGIFLNIFLFALKGAVGFISGSIAIVADAFNNFSDAGSSIITMVGFRIAGQEADSDHPYGHGRSEYISGLLVSIIILFVGFELIKSSIEKIIHPEPVEFSLFLVASLIVSIIVKFYMYLYNKSLAKKLDAAAMGATATDSINDVITTAVVLVASIIGHTTGVNVDGPCGILVGLVIIKGGIEVFRETSGLILGKGVDEDFKNQIYEIMEQEEYRDILGIHDLIMHDYGPGRRMVSFHAEVPAEGDILELHDMIDNVERELGERLHSEAVVHMDPIVTKDERINVLKEMVIDFAKDMGEGITIHDFRVVYGPTHTNLIFDMVLPFESDLTPREAKELITGMIRKAPEGNFYAVITVDRPA